MKSISNKNKFMSKSDFERSIYERAINLKFMSNAFL